MKLGNERINNNNSKIIIIIFFLKGETVFQELRSRVNPVSRMEVQNVGGGGMAIAKGYNQLWNKSKRN